MASSTNRYTLCAITDAGQDGAGPRGCWDGGSESQLLGEGFAANLTVLRALQRRARLSGAEAAKALCVSRRTYRRWLATGKPDPTAVRLLSVLAGYVPWICSRRGRRRALFRGTTR